MDELERARADDQAHMDAELAETNELLSKVREEVRRTPFAWDTHSCACAHPPVCQRTTLTARSGFFLNSCDHHPRGWLRGVKQWCL